MACTTEGLRVLKLCGNSIRRKPFFVNRLEGGDLALAQIAYDFGLITGVSSTAVLMLDERRS